MTTLDELSRDIPPELWSKYRLTKTVLEERGIPGRDRAWQVNLVFEAEGEEMLRFGMCLPVDAMTEQVVFAFKRMAESLAHPFVWTDVKKLAQAVHEAAERLTEMEGEGKCDASF